MIIYLCTNYITYIYFIVRNNMKFFNPSVGDLLGSRVPNKKLSFIEVEYVDPDEWDQAFQYPEQYEVDEEASFLCVPKNEG